MEIGLLPSHRDREIGALSFLMIMFHGMVVRTSWTDSPSVVEDFHLKGAEKELQLEGFF